MLIEEPRNIEPKGLHTYIHVEDEHGNRILSKKAETLVRAFYQILYGHMSMGSSTAPDTTGASQTITRRDDSPSVNAASGDATFGIVVGTGATPVSMLDYNLASPIPHGTGSGQLLYGETSITPVEVIGNIVRFYITRLLTNTSGADIMVNEVGLIAVSGATSPYKFLIDRTLATFIIPNGSSRNIIYEIRVVL